METLTSINHISIRKFKEQIYATIKQRKTILKQISTVEADSQSS